MKLTDNQDTKIFALGGLGEVGKNITVIEYGEEIIVVDCGMTFPDSEMYGIDVVIPDVSYLVKNKEKLLGEIERLKDLYDFDEIKPPEKSSNFAEKYEATSCIGVVIIPTALVIGDVESETTVASTAALRRTIATVIRTLKVVLLKKLFI